MGFPMATRTKRDDDGRNENEDAERLAQRAAAAGERDPLAALVQGLDELVPGLELIDRDLELEGGLRADLAAADPAGRLWLVRVAGDDPDQAALEALDLCARLARELELLVRHLGPERLRPGRPPRLVIVSPTCDERLAARLAPLAASGVEVIGLRSVKSAAGERAYLVRLEPNGRPVASEVGVSAFLRALPARHEALMHELIERMQRLDEELSVSADASAIVWRLGGEVLARVERSADGLAASVAPRHEPLALEGAPALERFVEQALARLVRVLGLARSGPGPEPGPRAVRPAARDDEPLLTDEELQAFRE